MSGVDAIVCTRALIMIDVQDGESHDDSTFFLRPGGLPFLRCLGDLSPHIPYFSPCASANAKHSAVTGHTAQYCSRASWKFCAGSPGAGRSAKKMRWSAPLHAASSLHASARFVNRLCTGWVLGPPLTVWPSV
jgi:hypothetical protein